MRLYVDMDGVLADFGARYAELFGHVPNHVDTDWVKVREVPDFYENLPTMPDFDLLWSFVKPFRPVLLTGIPRTVKDAGAQKRKWAEKHLGIETPVICCPPSEKYKVCVRGDVLIDDYEKYKNLWINMGGTWITHTSAISTVLALSNLTAGEHNERRFI